MKTTCWNCLWNVHVIVLFIQKKPHLPHLLVGVARPVLALSNVDTSQEWTEAVNAVYICIEYVYVLHHLAWRSNTRWPHVAMLPQGREWSGAKQGGVDRMVVFLLTRREGSVVKNPPARKTPFPVSWTRIAKQPSGRQCAFKDGI